MNNYTRPNMSPSLIDVLASHFECEPADLHRHWDRDEVDDLLAGENLVTLHLKEHNRTFVYGGLSRRCARHQMAYHGKLGISVEQHHFSRYKRELDFHYLPCVVELGGRGHRNLYPLEVVTLECLAD